MSIKDDLNRHRVNTKKAAHRAFVTATETVHLSIVDGHPITGAPGQPIQSGDLWDSFVPSFLSRYLWQDVTNLIYAPIIEDAIGITLRSPVGGFHSVKMTRSAWQRIVDDAITRNNGEAGPAASVSEIR
jgi:hypothetical protein